MLVAVGIVLMLINKKTEQFQTSQPTQQPTQLTTQCTACRRSNDELNKWYKVCTTYDELNQPISQSQVFCGKCKDIGFNILTCDSEDSQ